MTAAAWARLLAVQAVMLVATIAGWFILPLPCLLRAWRPAMSRFDKRRRIDEWTWPLNYVYGNPEDGVSGQLARVGGFEYLPGAGSFRRAYLWSAWRNSCDNLKYVFAWEQGPLIVKRYTVLGHTRILKCGWQRENGIKVPVLSP